MRFVSRKTLFALASVCALLASQPCTAQQDYPSRPIRFIVAAAAGAVIDLRLRVLARKLSERLGWTTVVENRPGNDQIVATLHVVQSPPDGYTILQSSADLALSSAVNKGKLPFELLRDLVPITRIAVADTVMVVHPSIPARNLAELIAYSKTNPGRLNFAAGGATTSVRFATEQIKLQGGLDATFVNYKTGIAFMPDLLNGTIQIGLSGIGNIADHVKNGKLRAIVLLQPRRNPALPDTQTTADAGFPNVEASGWAALWAPARTPKRVIDRLSREAAAVLGLPEVREQFLKFGATPMSETPEEFRKRVEFEMSNWERVFREAKIALD